MAYYDYKTQAINFIKSHSIKHIEDVIGIVMYSYLKVVEFKIMSQYHSESNKYCYQLTNGNIGTLPKCTIDRIANEILQECMLLI